VSAPQRRVEPPAAEAAVSKPAPKTVEHTAAAPEAEESAGEPVNKEWAQFLAAVKTRQTTTYALLFRHVSGELNADRLEISFARAALPAYRFIQSPENQQVLVAAAHELYGAGANVILKLEGAEQHVVNLTPKADAPPPLQEDLPPELFTDTVGEDEAPRGGGARSEAGFDPDRMSRAAEDMTSEISADPQPDDDEEKPDVGFITTLFDGQEIEKKEDSHEE
jgi:hypothetical protein